MLGLGQMGKTSDSLIRTGECVINLPSQDHVAHVDRLALTTGKDPVAEKKLGWGYRYDHDKFGVAEFTQGPSISVARRAYLSVQYKWRASCTTFAPSAKT